MDRTGRLRSDVTPNPTGEGELLEESPHALGVARDVRIELAVGPFQVGVGHQGGATVARTGNEDHI